MGTHGGERIIGDWALITLTFGCLFSTVAVGVLGYGAEWDPQTQRNLQNLTFILAALTTASGSVMGHRALSK